MFDVKSFVAEEYEQNIPLLLKENSTGSVHSVFENGVNIRMGNRLFFIGTTKNGRLPFGIHLQKETLKQMIGSIHPSDIVIWNENTKQLFFENGHVAVNLQYGRSYRNLVDASKPQTIISPFIKDFIQVLVMNGEMTGLDLDIGQFMIDYLEQRPPEKTVQQITRLMTAIYSDDRKCIEEVIRFFLGRGKGLTPSGDDHLVGLLAIQSISEPFSIVFLQTLKDILEQEMVTTDIGKEYLLYALNGEFSSSVVTILNALTAGQSQELEKNLLHLLSMGHSSGVDTAFGMLIGLLSIMNRGK